MTMLSQGTCILHAELAYKPNLEQSGFSPSFYTFWSQGMTIRKFDLAIR